MRKFVLLTCLALISLPVMAELLPCDVLKTRVDAKLQSKGIQSYTLEIMPIEDASTTTGAASAVTATITSKGKQVGTCDAGTKRLIYTRGN